MIPRPAEHMLHGLDGPVVVLEGRVCAILNRCSASTRSGPRCGARTHASTSRCWQSTWQDSHPPKVPVAEQIQRRNRNQCHDHTNNSTR